MQFKAALQKSYDFSYETFTTTYLPQRSRVERLFFAILIGAVVGVGAAMWLPREKAELIAELWQTVQAKAQGIGAARGATDRSTELSMRAPATTPLPAVGDGAPGDIVTVAYDEPASDSPAPEYPRTDAPEATASAERGGPAPRWNYPRGDENTVRGVEISRFEGTQILARVGPDVVLANEILPQVSRALEPYKGQMSPTQYEQQRLMLIQKLLGNAMDTKSVLVDARRKIPKEAWPDIQKQIDQKFEAGEVGRLMEQYEATSRADLVQKLNRYGSSLDLEKRMFGERSLCHQWIMQQVKKEEEITHEECVAYYRDHLADFEYEAEAVWEELTVRFDRFADKGEAFRAIAQMGNLVLDGAPFAEVAKARSQGRTADKGGVRDPVGPGSLASKVLDEAVFSLPIGSMSPILEGDQGFYIIRVTKRREAGRTPFEEAQVDVRNLIKNERMQARIKTYLAKIKDQTIFWTIFDDPDRAEEQLTNRPENPYQR